MVPHPSKFQPDITAAIKKVVRRHGKQHTPPETLKALINLQVKQSTIAGALKTATRISVKSYQISEWLRGTAPCPEKYHDGLLRILGVAIQAANTALHDAKQSGLYPLAALEQYRTHVRDAEQVLQAMQVTQGRLV